MKKMYKMLLLVLCAVLLVVGSVMGTLAYLQMSTHTVTNTFTVGKVEIKLEEYKLNEDGTLSTDKVDVTENNETLSGFKLLPGRIIPKNPFITVNKGSEKCYLFVKIENTIPNNFGQTDLNTEKWIQIDQTDYYYYSEIVDASEADKKVDVFTKFTCADVEKYGDTETFEIKVTAYAVQAEGFAGGAVEAWNATFGKSTT